MSVWQHEGAAERLRELWSRNESARVIADALAKEFGVPVSRSTVISKAHRIGCDSRASPIRRDRPPRRRRKTTVLAIEAIDAALRAGTAAGTAAGAAQPEEECMAEVARAFACEEETVDTDASDADSEDPRRPGDQPYSARHCQYPRGSKPHFDFCPERAAEGSAYCAAHHAVCWTKPGPLMRAYDPTMVRPNRSIVSPGRTAFT